MSKSPYKDLNKPRRPTGRKNGRPAVALTQEIIDQIVEVVEEGDWIDTGIALAGIRMQQGKEWLRIGGRCAQEGGSGKDGKLTAKERMCVRFSTSMIKALAKADRDDNAEVKKGGLKGAMFRLSRRSRGRWGDNVLNKGAEGILEETGVLPKSDQPQAVAAAQFVLKILPVTPRTQEEE